MMFARRKLIVGVAHPATVRHLLVACQHTQPDGTHIYNDLSGLWLVKNAVSKVLPLPNHYGVDDFPLIVHDKRLDNFGQPVYKAPVRGGFFGDTRLVNGAKSPFVEVSRGWVRLRLLDA